MTSLAQIKANQENSKLSTGPRTDAGKQAVGSNSITHGIISNRLLPHENKDEYQALLDGLLDELQPVGMLESAMVEKIAIIIWRQRRLIKAETSRIELEQTEKAMLEEFNKALGYGSYSENALTQKDLESVDWDNIEWCKQVIKEIDSDSERTNVSAMKKHMPLVYGQLESEAADDEETPSSYFDYLSQDGGIGSWLYHLKNWCQKEIIKANNVEKTKSLIPLIKDKLTANWHHSETLCKYQGSLDNQLFKTMKALREQQEYRQEFMATNAVEVN